MTNCLINQSACGRVHGSPVCQKCGLDEREVYTEEIRQWAEEMAEQRYLLARIRELRRLQASPVIAGTISNDSKVVGEVFRDAPWAPEMVALPSGKFLMGSPENEPGRHEDEGPQHQVTIDYKLAIGKYPVTFEEWDACLADVADGGTAYQPFDAGNHGWERNKMPVYYVSWYDAQQYIAWLNKKLGITPDSPFRYRLPSEAEWEYACRAGSTTMFSTPDGLISSELANYDAACTFEGAPKAGQSSEFTTPVGSYPANAWGLHDMHGNVWEWTEDEYSNSYRGAPTDGSPREGEMWRRVFRGGTYCMPPNQLRSASRGHDGPRLRNGAVGFRLARTVGVSERKNFRSLVGLLKRLTRR